MTQQFNPEAAGSLVRRVETPGFCLLEKYYPPGMSIPRHEHPGPVISFVLKGTFVELNSASQFTCEPLGLAINPAGAAHASRYGRGGTRCVVFEVKAQALTAIREFSTILDSPSYSRGGAPAMLAMRVYRELQLGDEVSPLAIEGLMLEMLSETSRRAREAAAPVPRWLVRARDYLHAGFAGPVDLTHVAEAAGVHQSHLSRAFSRHYGCSVGEYVRRLRVEQSARELLDTAKSLAEIASAAGFYDQSHFANTFRRYTGLTPTEFRRARNPRAVFPNKV